MTNMNAVKIFRTKYSEKGKWRQVKLSSKKDREAIKKSI